jgi:alpha-mannosidase
MRGPAALRVWTAGPLVGAIGLRGALRLPTGRVEVRMLLSLHAGSAALRCTLEWDNRATDHRLRVRVPTGVAGVPAVAGGPFGPVTRPPVVVEIGRYPLETPVATAPAQRWVAVADAERGLAVLAPGFFEYELAGGGDLVLTLFRAVGQLSREGLATRAGHAGWPVPTPEAQCLGPDRLQLAIAPVSLVPRDAGAAVAELWEDLFLPPQARWLRQATPLAPTDVGVALEGEGLVCSAIKPAEEGDGKDLVLRCYNARDARVLGRWRLARPAVRAARVRTDEREPRDIALADGGRIVPFEAGPREVVTVLVTPT